MTGLVKHGNSRTIHRSLFKTSMIQRSFYRRGLQGCQCYQYYLSNRAIYMNEIKCIRYIYYLEQSIVQRLDMTISFANKCSYSTINNICSIDMSEPGTDRISGSIRLCRNIRPILPDPARSGIRPDPESG